MQHYVIDENLILDKTKLHYHHMLNPYRNNMSIVHLMFNKGCKKTKKQLNDVFGIRIRFITNIYKVLLVEKHKYNMSN